MNDVEVIAGSRLHFGLLCAPKGARWHYGGIGMMLDKPGWDICFSTLRSAKLHEATSHKTDSDLVTATPKVAERITRILKTFRELSPELPAIKITARSEALLHAGLGSGTQLTLATVSALRLLLGKPREPQVGRIAESFGRSRRSAVGTFGFDHGGFIVDYGRSIPDGNQIQRLRFPEAWRMLLLTPHEKAGLSGDTEESFFGQQSFLVDDVVQRLETIVERELVVALCNEDFAGFASSLAAYGNLAGAYYASTQGGIFSSVLLQQVAEWLSTKNVIGAVQSSWGPTICLPAESEYEATRIRDLVMMHPAARELQISIARGLNAGATIKTTASEDHRSFG